MGKKAVSLEGMLDPTSRPSPEGIPQRGTSSAEPSRPAKRVGEKRLTLALDGETYRRLRMYAAESDQTHQAILEAALLSYLRREGVVP